MAQIGSRGRLARHMGGSKSSTGSSRSSSSSNDSVQGKRKLTVVNGKQSLSGTSQEPRRKIRLTTRGGAGAEQNAQVTALGAAIWSPLDPQLEANSSRSEENSIGTDRDAIERQSRRERNMLERWKEEYYDIVEQLPLELRRSFSLMKELEENVQKRSAALATLTKEYRESRLALRAHVSQAKDGLSAAKAERAAQHMEHDDACHNGDVEGNRRFHGSMHRSNTECTAASFVTPPSKRQRLAMLAEISGATSGAIQAAEEKVGLAVTAYEWVDRHIRRLDNDLQKSESSLLLGLRAGTEASRGVQDALGKVDGRKGRTAYLYHAQDEDDSRLVALVAGDGTNPKSAVCRSDTKETRRNREHTATAAISCVRGRGRRLDPPSSREIEEPAAFGHGPSESLVVSDMAIDPNEPRYCYCNQVSYGDVSHRHFETSLLKWNIC